MIFDINLEIGFPIPSFKIAKFVYANLHNNVRLLPTPNISYIVNLFVPYSHSCSTDVFNLIYRSY